MSLLKKKERKKQRQVVAYSIQLLPADVPFHITCLLPWTPDPLDEFARDPRTHPFVTESAPLVLCLLVSSLLSCLSPTLLLCALDPTLGDAGSAAWGSLGFRDVYTI